VGDREERAFLGDCFPCNARPFINRMAEILKENTCNNYPSLPAEAKLDFRACLWIINGQVHGQVATIDQGKEWDELKKSVEVKCG
jgi:hypothetical protein